MNKKYLLVIAAVVLIGAFLVSVFFLLKNPKNQNLQSVPLPTAQEKKLANFTNNFLSLYNSYSSEDYSNLYAVGSFTTEDFQISIIQTIANLEQSTPANFERRTETDHGSFKYTANNQTNITASIEGKVSETLGNKKTNYNITATTELIQINGEWFVNNIIMQTKK